MFIKSLHCKRYVIAVALCSAAAALLLSLPTFGAEERLQRKIVVFRSGAVNESAKDALVARFGGVVRKDLRLIGGKAVLLPPRSVAALAAHQSVLRVDDDIEVYALGALARAAGKPAPAQPPQSLPWGVRRVGADLVWGVTAGSAVKVAVVDTGIELSHPDLSGNIKGGYNAIDSWKSANDDNGHGTHVAGIIAAANNAIGVIGVGPAANLYAVKVLSRTGSGYLSDVIEGLDWAVANGMQVVNMSLGSSSDVQSFRDAVRRVYDAGVTMVAAAGNSGGAVNYPAAYPEVIAVSATDSGDALASWSSRGSEVDLAAPGVEIFSTYKGQTYRALSGTSMASPHVAGAVALLLSRPAKCDVNLDGACSPAEAQSRLEATANDLGVAGKDALYGAGLLNVARAVLE